MYHCIGFLFLSVLLLLKMAAQAAEMRAAMASVAAQVCPVKTVRKTSSLIPPSPRPSTGTVDTVRDSVSSCGRNGLHHRKLQSRAESHFVVNFALKSVKTAKKIDNRDFF